MLTKNQIKYIKSLSLKKNRIKYNVFIVEGEKIFDEIINSKFNVKTLYVDNENSYNKYAHKSFETVKISTKELSRITNLGNQNKCLAIIEIPKQDIDTDIHKQLSLVLDTIQDPGNLGTIIRIASWYGIKNIFCSNETVDVFSTKVIQATMGSIAYVNVHYLDLNKLISKYTDMPNFNIYGTFLQGENIYKEPLNQCGFIVIGNEGSGISADIEKKVNHKIFIPSFTKHKVESLNAATATAIICSEFRRR